MQIKWEAKDIVAGRRIRKPGCNEEWMIGYRVGEATSGEPPSVYGVVSLRDGMFTGQCNSKGALAEWLNGTEDQPVEVLAWNEDGRASGRES